MNYSRDFYLSKYSRIDSIDCLIKIALEISLLEILACANVAFHGIGNIHSL